MKYPNSLSSIVRAVPRLRSDARWAFSIFSRALSRSVSRLKCWCMRSLNIQLHVAVRNIDRSISQRLVRPSFFIRSSSSRFASCLCASRCALIFIAKASFLWRSSSRCFTSVKKLKFSTSHTHRERRNFDTLKTFYWPELHSIAANVNDVKRWHSFALATFQLTE